jgi:hypothetical protein
VFLLVSISSTDSLSLFAHKGRRAIRVREVPLSHTSLNSGDVFVLDDDKTIYVWNGSAASRMEKAKGVEVAIHIKDDERFTRATIVVLEENKDADGCGTFWEALGGKGPVKSAAEGGDDAEAEAAAKTQAKLYWLCDQSGTLQCTEIAERPLRYDMLRSEDAFVLDLGNELFVWVGRGATAGEKAGAMQKAQEFLSQQERPAWTPITRVVDRGETALFKQNFRGWPDPAIPKDFGKAPAPAAAKKPAVVVDVAKLHAGQQKQADADPFFRKTVKPPEKLEAWRVQEHAKVAVPPDELNILSARHCYIYVLTWFDAKEPTKPAKNLIYFWLGRHATQEDCGTAALLTVDLSDKLGTGATQVRLVQGKESEEFLALFKGTLLIKNDLNPISGTPRLFQVRGTRSIDVHAVEVDLSATSLNSNDSFVLFTPTRSFAWRGKGSSQDEHQTAMRVAKLVSGPQPLQALEEGSEAEEFWAALGGQKPYASAPSLYIDYREPRLFHCSDASGSFRVEEIFHFTQEDLIDADVFILDAFKEVYVWIGSGSTVDEKRLGMETAMRYVASAPDGRSSDTPIYRIEAGHEPELFTTHFHAWDTRITKMKGDAYDRSLAKLEMASSSLAALTQSTYPLDVLKKKPLPEGVDASRLEEYLSDADFEAAFKMKREAFKAIPKWKQLDIRRKVGLF